MALVYSDRVYETTTTTGTGTINLAGAVTGGYQTFVAGIGSTNTCYYCIVDSANSTWEVGLGTVTDATPDTLSRTTILDSSNAGSAVSFASGTKDVFCVMPANTSGTTQLTLAGDIDLTSNILINSNPLGPADQTVVRNRTLNNNTVLRFEPNGTANTSGLHFYNNSTWTNSPYAFAGINATAGFFGTTAQGVGTAPDVDLMPGNAVAQRLSATDQSTQFFGDIIMPTSGNIIGDFGNITPDSRPGFQTSVTNNSTVLHARPGSTGTQSFTVYQGLPLFANGQHLSVGHNNVDGIINSSSNGTGTTGGIKLQIDGSVATEIGTDLSSTFGGNIDLQGNDITSDFSNATHSSRTLFKSNTADSNTLIGVCPTGTGAAGQINLYDNSDVDNSGFMAVGTSGGDNYIQSKSRGTGSTLPMGFYIDATKYIELGIDGTTTFSGNIDMQSNTILFDNGVGLLSDAGGAFKTGPGGKTWQFYPGDNTSGVMAVNTDTSNTLVMLGAGDGLNGWTSYFLGSDYVTQLLAVDHIGNSVTMGCDLNLQGNNITGDFSNADPDLGSIIRSSTTNGRTLFPIMPNGTSTQSFYVTTSGPWANCEYGLFGVSGGEVQLAARSQGTGSTPQLSFFIETDVKFRIETDGTLTVGDTLNYETLVTHDDDIPNKKYVDDAVVGITDVVQDTTPQLGGDLDTQQFNITGDFSNATQESRSAFVTATTNGDTALTVKPNGTAVGTYINLSDNSNATNAGKMQIGINGTKAFVRSDVFGTGTRLPLELQVGTTPALTIGTDQNSTFAGDITMSDSTDIIGDFTTATQNNRPGFRTSVTNGSTFVTARPNGTQTQSGWTATNNSDQTNAGGVSTYIAGDTAILQTHSWGTGNPVDLNIKVDTTTAIAIDTSQNTTLYGNLNLQSNKILGDFSNASEDLRSGHETTAANSSTVIHNRPSGTGTGAFNIYQNANSFTNCSFLSVGFLFDEAVIDSSKAGSGTQYPLHMKIGNLDALTIDASRRLFTRDNAALQGSEAGSLTINTGVSGGASPHSSCDDLIVEGDNHNGMSIITPSLYSGNIYFGDAADNDVGKISYNHNGDTLGFTVGGTEQLQIASDGAVSLTGGLNIDGTYITGDWSNGTTSLRTRWMTNTVNGSTGMVVSPNGTGNGAFHNMYAQNDIDNTNSLNMGTTTSVTFLGSNKTGTGTAKPLQLQAGGVTNLTLNTDQSSTFAGDIDLQGNDILGDWSNATVNSRPGFQTTTSNGSTGVVLRPNGTGTGTFHVYQNDPDFTNCAYALVGIADNKTQIGSRKSGTGTAGPLEIDIDNSVALTIGTDLSSTFAGDIDLAGNDITGDFNNATKESRSAFVTTTTNANTALTVKPNGTASGAYINLVNNSNATNAGRCEIGVDTNQAFISSSTFGSGTLIPFRIYVGGTVAFEAETNGTLNVSGVTDYETLVTADDDIPNKKYVDDVLGKDLGEFTVANLPTASSYANYYALATNASGGRTVVRSDGTNWKVIAVEGATVTT